MFVLFAYWQFNDPDALMWVVIYLLVAGISAISIFKKLNRKILLFFLVFFFIYTASYTPYIAEWIQMGTPNIADEMKATAPYIERTREFFGLLICLGVVIYHYISSNKIQYNVQKTV